MVVVIDATLTCFQDISASGKMVKIEPKSKVIIKAVIVKSVMLNNREPVVERFTNSSDFKYSKIEENPKETRRINPKLPITPKDKSLDFKYNRKPDFILGRIPQIVFIES